MKLALLMLCLVMGGSVSVFATETTSETTSTAISSSVQADPKEVQQALTEAGYYKGTVDGVIGKKSKAAIREFQEANSLTADGVVGTKTWEKLKAYLEEAKDIDSAASTSTTETLSETSSAVLDETTTAAAPAVDESDYDIGYSEYDSDSTAQEDTGELKQKLVS